MGASETKMRWEVDIKINLMETSCDEDGSGVFFILRKNCECKKRPSQTCASIEQYMVQGG
jgi:hypothetical protein